MISVLADAIVAIDRLHPVRVGIDGRSTAGKSHLADELSSEIGTRDRSIVRVSIDHFHRPGHKFRSMRSEWTPKSYYDEGYDYDAFRDSVMLPLGPGGDRRYRPAIFDSYLDQAIPEGWLVAEQGASALIDGAFLRRPELTDHWDLMIWVDIDFETMIARARKRDVAWVGSEEVVAERYRRHWIPTHELYERLETPRDRADVVVDNRDIAKPSLTFRVGGPPA